MGDVVSSTVRSRMMSGIKGKNTKPEIIVRKALYRKGFRYRIHQSKLAGKPDIVLNKYKTVIFTHGCFWHGHECHIFKWPKSNVNFWTQKIIGNRKRDQKNIAHLLNDGWNVIVIWECALRGKREDAISKLISEIASEIRIQKSGAVISHAG